jgi:predicted esterase YcpF (UPF0227 family)
MFLVGVSRVRMADHVRFMPQAMPWRNLDGLMGMQRNRYTEQWFAGDFDESGKRVYEPIEKGKGKKKNDKRARDE